ncbi:hypothetical protein JCM8097_003997 [Rhodosporidiobolus ruineniae]
MAPTTSGRLYVELATAGAERGSEAAQGEARAVIIKAGQPYEVCSLFYASLNLADPPPLRPQVALKEVCTVFDVDQITHNCHFKQRLRGKLYVVGPSAWATVEPESELQLVVVPKNPPIKEPQPPLPVEKHPLPSPRGSAVLQSPPPDQPLPSSQPRTSQQGGGPLATPDHTDHSDFDDRPEDETIDDSDVESSQAMKGILQHRLEIFDEQLLEYSRQQNTPRNSSFNPPSSAATQKRRRSPSPSPSNSSTRKVFLRQRIAEDEDRAEHARGEEKAQGVAQQGGAPPSPSAGPSRALSRAASRSPSTFGEATASNRSSSFRSPSSAQPLPPTTRERTPPTAQSRLRSPTPPSHCLPNRSRGFSVGTEDSFAIGLNSLGEVDFVSAGSKRPDKGKGRAPPTPTPEEDEDEEEDGPEQPVKAEPVSSQPQPHPTEQVDPSFSGSSRSPSKRPLKQTSSAAAAAAFFPSSGDSSGSSSAPSASAQPLESISSVPVSAISSKKRRLGSASSTPGSSAKRVQPQTGRPLVRTVSSSPRPTLLNDVGATSSREQLGLAGELDLFLLFQRLTTVTTSSAALAAASSSTTTFARPRPLASPARSLPNLVSPSKTTASSARKPATAASRRKSLARKKSLSEAEIAELLAAPREPLPPLNLSGRFKLYVRAPNWPKTPNNALKSMLHPKLVRQVSARSNDPDFKDSGFDLPVMTAFEDAERLTGWAMRDMRFTFCPGTERERKVWGFDSMFAGNATFAEMGCANGEAIDIDWVPFDPHRSVFDDE